MDGAVTEERFANGLPALDEIALASAYDELPLWSAPFGLKLLETVALKPGLTALDIGCGTGFPLLELAQRLGPSAVVHGVDPWHAGLERVRHKLEVYGVRNVTLHACGAERLPLGDETVDLIVSNNGLNNVADVHAVVAECARVARAGAQLVYAYNLPETMRELYEPFDALLRERGLATARQALEQHIFVKRKPIAFTSALFERSGFRVERLLRDAFALRFADATAMFSHAFMRMAFVPSWLEILDPQLRQPLFAELERRLNAQAHEAGGLTLTIPFACYDCLRTGRTERTRATDPR